MTVIYDEGMVKVNLYRNFAANLAAALAERGISQEQLAEETGICRPQINRILKGKATNPTLRVCELLAEAAGINPQSAFVAPTPPRKTPSKAG